MSKPLKIFSLHCRTVLNLGYKKIIAYIFEKSENDHFLKSMQMCCVYFHSFILSKMYIHSGLRLNGMILGGRNMRAGFTPLYNWFRQILQLKYSTNHVFNSEG